MALPNPYQQYQKQQVNTSPKEKLLVMLYDGAIRFCSQAKKAIEENEMEVANKALIKVQNIVQELMNTLNMDYEISQQLYSLYDYFDRRLIEANMNKDIAIIDEVQGFLIDLRKTWNEATNLLKKESEL